MAIVSEDDLTYGLRGRVGDCVYRRFNGKTVVSRRPRKQNVSNQSVAQRSTRSNFKAAAAWAKAIRRDPKWEAFYRQRAAQLGLTNGYIAAIRDYMRNPEIGRREVVTRRPDGWIADVHSTPMAGWSQYVYRTPGVEHDRIQRTEVALRLLSLAASLRYEGRLSINFGRHLCGVFLGNDLGWQNAVFLSFTSSASARARDADGVQLIFNSISGTEERRALVNELG